MEIITGKSSKMSAALKTLFDAQVRGRSDNFYIIECAYDELENGGVNVEMAKLAIFDLLHASGKEGEYIRSKAGPLKVQISAIDAALEYLNAVIYNQTLYTKNSQNSQPLTNLLSAVKHDNRADIDGIFNAINALGTSDVNSRAQAAKNAMKTLSKINISTPMIQYLVNEATKFYKDDTIVLVGSKSTTELMTQHGLRLSRNDKKSAVDPGNTAIQDASAAVLEAAEDADKDFQGDANYILNREIHVNKAATVVALAAKTALDVIEAAKAAVNIDSTVDWVNNPDDPFATGTAVHTAKQLVLDAAAARTTRIPAMTEREIYNEIRDAAAEAAEKVRLDAAIALELLAKAAEATKQLEADATSKVQARATDVAGAGTEVKVALLNDIAASQRASAAIKSASIKAYDASVNVIATNANLDTAATTAKTVILKAIQEAEAVINDVSKSNAINLFGLSSDNETAASTLVTQNAENAAAKVLAAAEIAANQRTLTKNPDVGQATALIAAAAITAAELVASNAVEAIQERNKNLRFISVA